MSKYTEKEIKWAINELQRKHPERATREQAISLLDTLKTLPKFVALTVLPNFVSPSGR